MEEILARLPDLHDAQMEFVLLPLPKVAFVLRSCPPSKIRGATTAFDRAMREAVSDLVGAPLRLAKGHEFGVVGLYRTFSNHIFTRKSRCVVYLYTCSGGLTAANLLEPL